MLLDFMVLSKAHDRNIYIIVIFSKLVWKSKV